MMKIEKTEEVPLRSSKFWSQASSLTPETVTDLELIMTNSAFGYEYAKGALEKSGDFGVHTERLIAEIDAYKQTYFHARQKLQGLDETRLCQLEDELKLQKLVVFSEPRPYLH